MATLLSRAAARPWVNCAHARPSVYHRMGNLRRSQRELGAQQARASLLHHGVGPNPLLESCRPAGLFFLISHFPPPPKIVLGLEQLPATLQTAFLYFCIGDAFFSLVGGCGAHFPCFSWLRNARGTRDPVFLMLPWRQCHSATQK